MSLQDGVPCCAAISLPLSLSLSLSSQEGEIKVQEVTTITIARREVLFLHGTTGHKSSIQTKRVRIMKNNQQKKRYHFLGCPVVRYNFAYFPEESNIFIFKVEK
jgi:hypothetical protein